MQVFFAVNMDEHNNQCSQYILLIHDTKNLVAARPNKNFEILTGLLCLVWEVGNLNVIKFCSK